MSAKLEKLHEQLRELDKKLNENPGENSLSKQKELLLKEIDQVNKDLNDKSKILKG